MPDWSSDEQLVIAYRSGAEWAFRELFRRYALVLARSSRREVGPDEAASVANDSLMKAVARFDETRGIPFKRFLWRVWEDEHIDAIRRVTTRAALLHRNAMQLDPTELTTLISPRPGPHDEALWYDAAPEIVKAIGRKIDLRYHKDEPNRLIHHGVLKHLDPMGYPKPGLRPELLKELARHLGCPAYKISRAHSRIQQFAREVLRDLGRND